MALADQAIWYAPANLGWDLAATVAGSPVPTTVCDSLDAIIAKVKADATPGTQVVVMSNGGFVGCTANWPPHWRRVEIAAGISMRMASGAN